MAERALRDRAIQAEHVGRCGLCQRGIEEGDWIVKYEKYEESWVHLACAEAEDA